MTKNQFTTNVSDIDIANGIADEYGVLYSSDNNRLLKCADNDLTEYTIRDGTEVICECAFEDCLCLTDITIPNSVTMIGSYAFRNCKALTKLSIPANVNEIRGTAFIHCDSMVMIWVSKENEHYCSEEGVLYTKDKSTLVRFPSASPMKSYEIPYSTTIIGDSAFDGCKSLIGEITIPSSVKNIGDGAFCECKNLTQVTIGKRLMRIGRSAFYGCTGLTEVTIPDSVNEIEDGTFFRCVGLAKIDIPDSVKNIGDCAFCECTNITQVTIGKEVMGIGRFAFQGCTNLTQVTIPNSVTNLGMGAFQDCTSLTQVTIGGGAIGEGAFSSCRGLTQVSIGNSVTSISRDAFEFCSILKNTEVAEDNEFYCAINGVLYSKDKTTLVLFPHASPLLPSFDIPESVTHIGDMAFHNCTGLKEVVFPESVTSIGWEAFHNCTGIVSLISLNTKPPQCGFFVFYNVSASTCTLYVPEGSAEAYSKADGWKEFKHIIEDEYKIPEKDDDTFLRLLNGSEVPIADDGIIRVDYDIPPETRDEIDWKYPVVKYPQYGCVVFPYRNRSIARMGYMEPFFLEYLQTAFEGYDLRIIGDCSILPLEYNLPYEPDIAIIPNEHTSIRIDVEIDEPYAAVTNKPIHYIGCGDDFRDMNLNNLGWIVIRFTEYQVYSDMKGCVAFIAQVLHNIQPRMSLPTYLLSYPVPETEERWQEIEAKVLATEKYRENYLKHKFTESEERKYTTADVTQTELEKECAELVSPLIVSPTSKTADEAIDRGDISTRQKHTDKCQEAQHDAASIGTNHTDVVSAPSTVLPVAIEKRDEHIQFFPFEHVYLYNGCVKLTPVSSVIDCFFEQFDAVTQAHAKAYKDMPAGKILEDWDIKGCMAKEAGTFMHKQIENVYNGLEYQKIYHFRYDGKYLHADKEISLEREYQHFQNFLKDHDFKPHKTEWAIYDENLEIAGTIDMLHKRGDEFDIYDWKRSNKIVDDQGTPVKIGFRGKSGINGLECVQDTAYWHYCIQQNLYRYILEKNYGITVGKMYLVVMIATMDNYIKLEVPRMNEAIEVIVEKCRNGFLEFMDSELPF